MIKRLLAYSCHSHGFFDLFPLERRGSIHEQKQIHRETQRGRIG